MSSFSAWRSIICFRRRNTLGILTARCLTTRYGLSLHYKSYEGNLIVKYLRGVHTPLPYLCVVCRITLRKDFGYGRLHAALYHKFLAPLFSDWVPAALPSSGMLFALPSCPLGPTSRLFLASSCMPQALSIIETAGVPTHSANSHCECLMLSSRHNDVATKQANFAQSATDLPIYLTIYSQHNFLSPTESGVLWLKFPRLSFPLKTSP